MGGIVVGYFDGLMSPTNPDGYGCGGWFIEEDGVTVVEEEEVYYEPGQQATNNMAEYRALISLLEKARELGYTGITIRGDSQLVIRQVEGVYRVNSDLLKPLHKEAVALAHAVNPVFEWVRRDENWRADQLSEKAYSDINGYFRNRTSSNVSVEFYEYICDSCKSVYVMRVLDKQTYCVLCAKPLRRKDFSMRNAPSGRVLHMLREAGYRTIMYRPPES